MERILIVDDADLNRDMLAMIFEEQYEVLEAADGEEACKILEEQHEDISLMFLDFMMPKKNGLEVLSYMRHMNIIETIPVIMITGESTIETDIKAYEYGADDVIYKPFSSRVVTRRAMNLIEQYSYRKHIEIELAKRTEEAIETQKQMASMNEFLLDALGSVVEFRSLESGAHVKRVKYFTKIILECVRSCYPEYELTKQKIELMSQASALHDVGKIGIPDDILKAPRILTSKEFNEMKKHTILGCEILDKFKLMDNEFFKYCYDICRWHHEKADGNGYPDGLKGDEIPIYCQAAAIADCFDALISQRVYKDAVGCVEAYNMIMDGECGAFSEVILKCFEMAKLEMFMAVEKIQKQQLQGALK